MKKLGAYLLVPALLLGAGTTFQVQTVSAQSASDIQKEINDLNEKQGKIREQQSNISGNKQSAEEKLNKNLDKQNTVEKQLTDIEDKLQSTQKKVSSKQQEITKTNEQLEQLQREIKKLHKEIAELRERIKKREEILKDRLKSLQETGGDIKYLEVLMGSQSIGDFINRSTSVGTIMDQDKKIMEELEADKKSLENKKASVEKKRSEVDQKKANLVAAKKELLSLKATLDNQKADKDKIMDKLEKEHKHLESYKVSLEDEEEILAAQAQAVEKAISLAQGKKGKLEEQTRQAAERERQARLAKQQTSSSSHGSSNGSSNGSTPSTGGSGMFIWPASGSVSSGYGHRWGTLHAGLDVANSTGTPVKAAAPGVVISTNTPNDGKMNGYGNVVLIAHSIGGTTYTTLYAHMSEISVSAGQQVSAGDRVGAIGSTGQSTGPHLHFEVHRGGWNAAKSNSLDPATVLP